MHSERGPSSSTPLRADLLERVRFVDDADTALAGADVLVAASDGVAPAPGLIARAQAAGAVPLASRLAVYEEVLGDGEAGLLFEPNDLETLTAQLGRLVVDGDLRERLRAAARPRPWSVVADELEALYRTLAARRHGVRGNAEIARRLQSRRTIDVDLHMHTDHSHDCATPVEVLLATARAQGLGAIAVTDHNEVSGALEAAAKAADYGVKVIVGEEVKTAHQGEVIGLFLQGEDPARADAGRDGGRDPPPGRRRLRAPSRSTACTPSPTTSTCSAWSRTSTRSRSTTRAWRSARSTRRRRASRPSTASWPAPARTPTSPRAWARCACACPTSTGRTEFLEALRAAEIITKPSSLLYVQALKFLETKATPSGARERRRERRVRRAIRKP